VRVKLRVKIDELRGAQVRKPEPNFLASEGFLMSGNQTVRDFRYSPEHEFDVGGSHCRQTMVLYNGL
jgi:hypothetical protein